MKRKREIKKKQCNTPFRLAICISHVSKTNVNFISSTAWQNLNWIPKRITWWKWNHHFHFLLSLPSLVVVDSLTEALFYLRLWEHCLKTFSNSTCSAVIHLCYHKCLTRLITFWMLAACMMSFTFFFFVCLFAAGIFYNSVIPLKRATRNADSR